MSKPAIAVVNAAGLDLADVIAAVEAIQRQVDEHFEPAWGAGASLLALVDGDEIPPDVWPVRLVPTCDEPGALGYHDDQDRPSGIVGVQQAAGDGIPWSSVLSHEILELLGDPWADRARQVGSLLYAEEACDPVEGAPYQIDGVWVENFVHPSWFRSGSLSPYDHLGVLKAPLSLAPGGYCSIWDGKAWSQANAEKVRGAKVTIHPTSRRGRRAARGVPMSLPITQHFSLDEFACKDGTPYPVQTPEDDGTGPWLETRLRPLCNALEAIRADLGGHSITILSGYRSPAHNLAVGGAKQSQHMAGRAADITVEGIAPSDVHASALKLVNAQAIEIGGIGLYPGWVHVDVRPRVGGHLARWNGSKVGDEIA